MFLSIVFYLCVAVVATYLVVQLAGLLAMYLLPISTQKEDQKQPENLPFISVLLAARNEENNIKNCLQALCNMDYPLHKIEILIGNDDSYDQTAEIVTQFAANYPHVRLLNIEADMVSSTKGKARVLSVLAKEAKGEFLFITDADIQVGDQWVKGILKAFDSDTALVSATTFIKSDGLGFFAKMQQVDWAYFLGLIQAVSHFGLPVTAVGNNMAVLKKAYEKTGGYEAIPFSITEDFALFSAIRAQGLKTKNIISSTSTVFAAPIRELSTLFHQRKRWLTGAKGLPLKTKILVLLFGLYYLAFPFILLTNVKLAMTLWFARFGLFVLTLFRLHLITQTKPLKLLQLLAYEGYIHVFMPLYALFFAIKSKVNWKERSY